MPTFSYSSSSFPFQQFTKIYSADVNQCFNDLSTFLNTTKLNSSNIQAGGIATSNIANQAVTTALIADANVTRAKLVSVGQQISTSSGAYTTTSSSFGNVTNLSVTITTTGRPVKLMLISDGTGNNSCLNAFLTGSGDNAFGFFQFKRDSTVVATCQISGGSNTSTAQPTINLPPSFSHLDAVAAGTYTYTFQAKSDGASTVGVKYINLVAYEL